MGRKQQTRGLPSYKNEAEQLEWPFDHDWRWPVVHWEVDTTMHGMDVTRKWAVELGISGNEATVSHPKLRACRGAKTGSHPIGLVREAAWRMTSKMHIMTHKHQGCNLCRAKCPA